MIKDKKEQTERFSQRQIILVILIVIGLIVSFLGFFFNLIIGLIAAIIGLVSLILLDISISFTKQCKNQIQNENYK